MKILIVEDDTRVAELIERSLRDQGMSTRIAYDGYQGYDLISQHSFDLLVTDIALPGINGLDLCRKIRLLKPGIPIIILTALGTTDDKLEGFDAGADDYLVKPFETRELIARIRALLKRSQSAGATSPPSLRVADLEINLHTKTASRNGHEIHLTPKEFKLLQYMMQNAGRVLSRAEIAEKVWETYFDTGTNFIDVYINYLRKKIDRNFDSKLIHTRAGMGFIMKESL